MAVLLTGTFHNQSHCSVALKPDISTVMSTSSNPLGRGGENFFDLSSTSGGGLKRTLVPKVLYYMCRNLLPRISQCHILFDSFVISYRKNHISMFHNFPQRFLIGVRQCKKHLCCSSLKCIFPIKKAYCSRFMGVR